MATKIHKEEMSRKSEKFCELICPSQGGDMAAAHVSAIASAGPKVEYVNPSQYQRICQRRAERAMRESIRPNCKRQKVRCARRDVQRMLVSASSHV